MKLTWQIIELWAKVVVLENIGFLNDPKFLKKNMKDLE